MASDTTTRKSQIYYPHSANARNEDNMIRLRMAHGVAGYGVYHMLLERLRLAEDYKCDLDYEILSWDLDCSIDLIRSVIYDFGLFEIVDEGQHFSSVELNAYMRLMEQRAAERRERAKEAANARWGNMTKEKKPVEDPELPLAIESDKQEDTSRLDKEIETIKEDGKWLDEMAKESGKTRDEILSYLQDFHSQCVLRGLKGGHKDMTDTFTHFRSWIYKSGRAKDPNAKQDNIYHGARRGKTNVLSIHHLDNQAAERAGKWKEFEEQKVKPEDYIRNKGYDPKKVTIVQLMQPHWKEKNPPTHPEWIGQFISNPEPIELPY